MCEISTYRSNATGTIRQKYAAVAVTVVFAFVVAEMQLRCAFLVAVSVVTFGKLYFYLVRLPNKTDNTLCHELSPTQRGRCTMKMGYLSQFLS